MAESVRLVKIVSTPRIPGFVLDETKFSVDWTVFGQLERENRDIFVTYDA